jgi:hypothetical protein
MKAEIMGPIIPALEGTILCIDSPVTRSLLLRDFIEIIFEAESTSFMDMVSYTPIRAQNSHVVTKKRSNAAGTYDALPTRYSIFKVLLRSVNQPEGSTRNMFIALLTLRISPISTVVAPKRLIKTDHYSLPSIPRSLPIPSLARNTL